MTNHDAPNCNCAWIGCAVHPGGLCSNAAEILDCNNPDCTENHQHGLGDRTLGEGVHICRDCGMTILSVLAEELLELMADLTAFVPNWMRPLEGLCRAYYKTNLMNEGWVHPTRDAMGVLALAYAIVKVEDSVPADLIVRLHEMTGKIQDIHDAFASVKLEEVKD